MKSLVIGMGIGALYLKVLTQLGHEVITVDSTKMAHYKDVEHALKDHPKFDATFICTPNHTHKSLAWMVADASKIVFVEKPGLKSVSHWETMVAAHPRTRFIMVKNNQYRDEIVLFKALADRSPTVNINWINQNRVPHPGSWFTQSSYSWGGVSRDLIPHLLSIVTAIKPDSYRDAMIVNLVKKQRWQWDQVLNTEYGTVHPTGIYDVDDYAHYELQIEQTRFNLTADWRSMDQNDRSITFISDRERKFELGLCPESAYKTMIETAFNNISNMAWWLDQLQQDLWIHSLLGPYEG
jgi:predicted dehydrogenase